MKVNEREQFIIDLLNKTRFASVKHIAEVTFTSESSIRRDLTRLENAGIVKRSYGGVTLCDEETEAPPIYMRKDKNRQAKKNIAERASVLLKDGMTVILDSSTTAFYMLKYIAEHKNMTVITNSLLTATATAEAGINLYSSGGSSVNGSLALTGAYAEETLEKVYADIVFFSSFAISDDGVISDCNEAENKIRKTMLKRAKTKVLLIDKSKFGKMSTHVLCRLDEIDHYFTD